MTAAPFVLPPPPPDFRPGDLSPTDAWLDGYIRHFSASSLRLLKICPEAYRQRYILGLKERPGEALTVGKAVHAAVGFSHEQKISSHEDLPVPEVVEYYHDKAWPDAVEMDGGESEIRWDGKPEVAREDGRRVTVAYHAAVSPRIQPLAVEQRFDITIPGVPVHFTGFLDVVEETDVIDVKTGKQVQRKPDANWRTQGLIYLAATGKAVHFHSVSRAKTPSIATPLESPDMVVAPHPSLAATVNDLLLNHARLVEWYFTQLGPDQPWPQNGLLMDYKGGPACNFCGFRKWCPAWEWERVTVVEQPS